MRFPVRLAASLCAAVLLVSSVRGSGAQAPYHVVDHWKLGGVGGWDYLLADPGAHLLYVTHGTRVEVVDTQMGKPVGAITGMKGTHGVALDTDGRFGYISDGGSNAVVVFDRKTFATVATIPTGTNPDGIAFEPSTKTVWAFNGRSKNATVIDAVSRTALATIELPGKPEFPQADGRGAVFVNIEDKKTASVRLDAATKKVTATWPLAGCESPSGLAYDAQHHRLFAVCDGKKMAVVDAESGTVLATPTIGDGPDAAGYDANDQLAFSSNGAGTLSVIDAAHDYKTVATVPTLSGARTMTYDAGVDRIYLATAQYGPRPEATSTNPRPRPTVLPDSFSILVVGRK